MALSKKINITVNEELLSQIDEFASSRHMSRSAFLGLAASSFMQSQEHLTVQRDLFRHLSELAGMASAGQISFEEFYKELNNGYESETGFVSSLGLK